jgi:hypothetical protein
MERADFSGTEAVLLLRRFPNGCCKHALWLLARYLVEERGTPGLCKKRNKRKTAPA